MTGVPYLRSVIKSQAVDICGLSEHWLFAKDLDLLDSISTEYITHGVSDSDLLIPSSRKVGKGGVALLWHRRLENCISILDVNDDRIIGIDINPI